MNASWHNSSGTSNTQQNSGDVKRWKSMRIRMSERMRKMMSKKRMRWRKRKRKRRRKSMPGLNVDGVRCLQCGTYTVMNGESSARSVGHRLIPELSLQFPEKIVFLVAIGIYAFRSFAWIVDPESTEEERGIPGHRRHTRRRCEATEEENACTQTMFVCWKCASKDIGIQYELASFHIRSRCGASLLYTITCRFAPEFFATD